MQQSERGRTAGKLFLAEGKLPRSLRESGCWAFHPVDLSCFLHLEAFSKRFRL